MTTPPKTPRELRRSVLAVTAGLLFLASVVAVLAGGLTPKGTQPPLVHPIQGPETGGCSICHGQNWDAARPVEPYDAWAGSLMANASRDPLFWAALDVANNDLPGSGDFCLRCHVPSGWYSGRSEPPGGTTDGCAMLGPIDAPDNDFEGISCHFCHRTMVNPSPPPGEEPFYTENGQVWLDDGTCGIKGEPCRHGPYDYPQGGPDFEPPHAWAYSAHFRSAAFCGACHNVTSPVHNLRDETGADTGIPYPIERTYKEWELSAFAPGGTAPTTCQQCHMPLQTGDDVFACNFGMANQRGGNLRSHQFVGGNRWIPQVLAAEYGVSLNRLTEFQETIDRAGEMLHQAAELSLTAPPVVQPGQPFPVTVRVTNLSGHKLPTGYPEGRRLWLQVSARDGNGDVVWQSGAYDAATGVLTEDPQIRIYQAKPGIWNGVSGQCEVTDSGGQPAFHFVLNDCWKSDNRIPPLGFRGGTDLEVRPVGQVYPETFPGSGELVNWDDAPYQVVIPPGTPGEVTLEARLLFQVASKEYVEFLRDQAVDNDFPDDCTPRITPIAASRGEYLFDLWQEHDRAAPFEMDAEVRPLIVGPLFRDGFESGGTAFWSLTVPFTIAGR
jgi:hypothetical protein